MKKIIMTALFPVLLLNSTCVKAFPKVKTGIKLDNIQVSEDWSTKNAHFTKNEPAVKWWEQFNDKYLTQYICDAVQFNYDLQAAAARIQQTRALRAGASADLFPQIDANTNYSRYQLFAPHTKSSSPAIGVGKSLYTYWAGLDASWEIDFFGKKRWQVTAAEERIGEAYENRRALMVSLIAELARNYMELRKNQSLSCNLKETIELQKQYLQLVQTKQAIGLATQIDTENAKADLASMQSQLPQIEAQIKNAVFSISVLTGRNPDALLCELQQVKPLPNAINVTPVGLPADIILRRPDIRQAQRNLGAIIAEVGSTRANLYPSVGLKSNFGFRKIKLGDLLNLNTGIWSISSDIDWKIFDRRTLTANLNAKKAQAKEADAQLRQTVLDAIKDVESSITNLEAARKTKEVNCKNLLADKNIYEITNKGYEIGLRSRLDTIQAQKAYLDSKSSLIQSSADINLSLINLYKALGGGWESF